MRKLIFVLIATLVHLAVFSQDTNVDVTRELEKTIMKGDSLANLKQFDTSIECYTRALDLTVDRTGILYKRAMIYFAKKDYSKAISDYTEIINTDSELITDAYFFRGMSRISADELRLDGCEDLAEAKRLGFVTDWEGLRLICNNL